MILLHGVAQGSLELVARAIGVNPGEVIIPAILSVSDALTYFISMTDRAEYVADLDPQVATTIILVDRDATQTQIEELKALNEIKQIADTLLAVNDSYPTVNLKEAVLGYEVLVSDSLPTTLITSADLATSDIIDEEDGVSVSAVTLPL